MDEVKTVEITDQASKDARAIAITRGIVAAITIINLVAQSLGWTPLDVGYETVYAVVSGIAAIVATAWAWWRNNNITKAAQEAQGVLNGLKDK